MQFNVLYVFTAAIAVGAIPTTASSSSVVARAPVTPNIKNVNGLDIDFGKCAVCFNAVSATISSCEPILENWTGWMHWGSCINQVTKDFSALTDDCIPCLQSFVD